MLRQLVDTITLHGFPLFKETGKEGEVFDYCFTNSLLAYGFPSLKSMMI